MRSETPLDFVLKKALLSRINTNKHNLTNNELKLKKVLELSKKDKTYDNLLLRMLTHDSTFGVSGAVAGSGAGLPGMIIGSASGHALSYAAKDRYARKHLNLLKNKK